MKKSHIKSLEQVLNQIITYDRVNSIYLFGSCVRNEETYRSDVDIACFIDGDMDTKLLREIRSIIPDEFRLPEVDINIWFNTNQEDLINGNRFEKRIYNDMKLLWSKKDGFSNFYNDLRRSNNVL